MYAIMFGALGPYLLTHSHFKCTHDPKCIFKIGFFTYLWNAILKYHFLTNQRFKKKLKPIAF